MIHVPASPTPTVFTIGHSNHPPEVFIALLKKHDIGVVVDVRSSPYSQYALHFNKEAIQRSLKAHGIKYLFLGGMLGGRPANEDFYDTQGHVLYDRLRESDGFQQGIARLLDGIRTDRVALLCGEEDPTDCHRRRLVGRVLCEMGVSELHIRGDGRVQTEEELSKEEEFRKTKGQLSLFETGETEAWISTRSVSHKKMPPNSSAF